MAELNLTPVLIQTVAYIRNLEDKILLIHKDKDRPHDPYADQDNGIGGSVRPHEDTLTGFMRESIEEGGLALIREQVIFCGQVQVHNVFNGLYVQLNVFTYDNYSGPFNTRCNEGTLEWVTKERALELHRSPPDKHMLKLILSRQIPFFGTSEKTPTGSIYDISPAGSLYAPQTKSVSISTGTFSGIREQ